MSSTMRIVATALLFSIAIFGAYAQTPAATFVFVKIQDPVLPVERGSKYEDPLDASLRAARLGEVTGGGSMLNKDNSVAWVGIDVDLYDLKRGLPFLIAKLRELRVPPGSTIEYTDRGKRIQQPVYP